MNSKLKKKILLDVVMTILLIVLMGYFASGALWHEIIGVAVLLMVIFHNLINIKWYIGILFHKSKNLNYKIYLSLITNLLLVINTLILLVSSIIISRKLFTMFNLKPTELWYYLHRASGYLELIIVSIHLGLHWKMIMVSFRKLFKLKENNKIRNIILRIIAFLLAVFGVKA